MQQKYLHGKTPLPAKSCKLIQTRLKIMSKQDV